MCPSLLVSTVIYGSANFVLVKVAYMQICMKAGWVGLGIMFSVTMTLSIYISVNLEMSSYLDSAKIQQLTTIGVAPVKSRRKICIII